MVADYSPKEREFLRRAGQHFRVMREAKNISQESLAEKSGVERSYIGKLERGVQNASLLKLKQLAEGLEVHPSTLLEFPFSDEDKNS